MVILIISITVLVGAFAGIKWIDSTITKGMQKNE